MKTLQQITSKRKSYLLNKLNILNAKLNKFICNDDGYLNLEDFSEKTVEQQKIESEIEIIENQLTKLAHQKVNPFDKITTYIPF